MFTLASHTEYYFKLDKRYHPLISSQFFFSFARSHLVIFVASVFTIYTPAAINVRCAYARAPIRALALCAFKKSVRESRMKKKLENRLFRSENTICSSKSNSIFFQIIQTFCFYSMFPPPFTIPLSLSVSLTRVLSSASN